MNLKEQILRIQEIMNKDSLKRKVESFQKLVDTSVDNLKNICKTMEDSETDDEPISSYACWLIDVLENVRVTDVKNVNGVISLLIVIKYKNHRYLDEEPFVYELKNELKNNLGINIKIEVEDHINTFPPDQRNW